MVKDLAARGGEVFVSGLLEQGVNPAAIRVALMRHHYRSSWEWKGADLADAALAAVDAWVDATLGTDGVADTRDTCAAMTVRRLMDAALGLAV